MAFFDFDELEVLAPQAAQAPPPSDIKSVKLRAEQAARGRAAQAAPALQVPRAQETSTSFKDLWTFRSIKMTRACKETLNLCGRDRRWPPLPRSCWLCESLCPKLDACAGPKREDLSNFANSAVQVCRCSGADAENAAQRKCNMKR